MDRLEAVAAPHSFVRPRYARGVARFLAAVLAAQLFAATACAETFGAGAPALRALVIGNAAYVTQPLANATNDAALIGRTLGELGFEVTQASDLDRQGLYASVRTFTESLPEDAVALVYFAGHGVQIEGVNYLLPVDVGITNPRNLTMRAFPLEGLLERLKRAKSAVNIVILDACRNNPFEQVATAKYRGSRDLGLAAVTSPKGTLVAYSTAPGQVAADGIGRKNSIFTESLAREMRREGRTIEDVLKAVAESVRQKTADEQQPWFETSLVDRFYFRPPPGIQMVTGSRKLSSVASLASNAARLSSPTAGGSRGLSPADAPSSSAEGGTGSPLPRDTPVTEVLRKLLPEANRGDTAAQCRVGVDLGRCRLQLAGRNQEIMWLQGLNYVDDAQTRLVAEARIREELAFLHDDDDAQCAGITENLARSGWAFLLDAARSGSRAAMYQFASQPYIFQVNNVISPGMVEALQHYREEAPGFLWTAIERGDVRALYWGSFSALTGFGEVSETFPRDPYVALVYTHAVMPLSQGRMAQQLPERITKLSAELGPARTADALRDGDRLREERFSHARTIVTGADLLLAPEECGR